MRGLPTLKRINKVQQQNKALNEALEDVKKCQSSNSQILEIGYNGYLNVFPEEIRKFKWLTSLSFVCTDISILPDWIYCCP